MAHAPLPTKAEIAALPADGGPEFNRLIFEASPYLRQHARNPVDWHPWGEEAFSLARELDRPIFLSVGYSTCHWCHVMERESFESPGLAAQINESFIAIKVDREERPDVDEIHMKATQMMTGQGGWPNSVWLTPDLRPWYAGTYFPPEDSPGRTGFGTLLGHLVRIWREQRSEVEEQAKQLTTAVTEACSGGGAADPNADAPGRADLDRLLHELRRTFDPNFGGFGGAPKFPPHGSLRILAAEVVAGNGSTTDLAELRSMLVSTLEALRSGGIHDQLGGGFHRYSTDREWLLPHFEKMLYDNAQLLSVFARAEHAQVEGVRAPAAGIVRWVEREMTAPEGGFYAALDADSEGVEGKCYLWTPLEVTALLGGERGKRFCLAYDITEDGNFTDEATGEHPGTSVPRVIRPLAEIAEESGLTVATLEIELAEDRDRLLEVRNTRIQPHLDDKVITSWCALFAGALAEAGACFSHPEWIESARRAVEFLLDHHVVEGQLHRSSREGVLGPLAFLEDHAALGLACLDLEAAGAQSAGGAARFREEARQLATRIVERFTYPGGGFYDAAEDHDHLLVRPRDPFDPAMPSGNGLAARLFHRLSILDNDEKSGEIADRSLRAFASAMRRAPRGTESLLEVVSARAESPEVSPEEGGTISEAWAEGRVRVKLDRLVVGPGESIACSIDASFDQGGRWQSGGNEGPAVTISGDGFSWRELSRSASAVSGEILVAKGISPGPHVLTFSLSGEPCRRELCLAPVSLELAAPVLVTV